MVQLHERPDEQNARAGRSDNVRQNSACRQEQDVCEGRAATGHVHQYFPDAMNNPATRARKP